MGRVTATEVKSIISTDLADATVDVFIGVANRIVTEILNSDSSLSDAQKADIELFLSAHILACTREQQPIEEGIDEARIRYQGKTGTGLDATFYGQQVKIIDTSGKMAQHIGQKAVKVYAITSFEDT